MDILKYISFSLLENIGQKSRSDYRGETQKFTWRFKIKIINFIMTICPMRNIGV